MTSIQSRIDRLVGLAEEPESESEAIAARRLYSTLSQLEYIAVIAAERGDGIEGQLDDELVHRGVFIELARNLGGVCPSTKETRVLIRKLEAMHGPQSLLLLNVVAETWLETVFDELAKPGWGSELFAAIEGDEARHVAGAWASEIPDASELVDDLSDIEKALSDIGLSMAFILPIRYLRGVEFCGNMGLAAIKSHKAVCSRLNVGVGRTIGKLAAFSRGIKMFPPPDRIEPSPGRLSLMRASKTPFTMDSIITINRKPERTVATVVIALSKIMCDNDCLRRVIRGDFLYQHSDSAVFVRVKLKTGIASINIKNAFEHDDVEISRQMRKQRKRLSERKHHPFPELGDMEPILPPARASMVVTDISHWGFDNGTTPVIPAEGIPIVVTIGMVKEDSMVISFTMDHRVYDASDMGLLRDGLVKHLS